MIKELNSAYRIKCDTAGCKNYATYKIILKPKISLSTGVYVCTKCAKDMYEDLGKLFVPKSPVNMIKKNLLGGTK